MYVAYVCMYVFMYVYNVYYFIRVEKNFPPGMFVYIFF